MIQIAKPEDFQTLLQIWEASVRATHDFLPEAEILKLKPLILEQYFPQVHLNLYRENDVTVGFLGTSDDNIEMLFIDPEFREKGIGKQLIQFALNELNIHKVDVNEQNPQAVGFYQKLGFKIISRSELDGQGNPYPLLHMLHE